jgi:hypothetical protein
MRSAVREVDGAGAHRCAVAARTAISPVLPRSVRHAVQINRGTPAAPMTPSAVAVHWPFTPSAPAVLTRDGVRAGGALQPGRILVRDRS